MQLSVHPDIKAVVLKAVPYPDCEPRRFATSVAQENPLATALVAPNVGLVLLDELNEKPDEKTTREQTQRQKRRGRYPQNSRLCLHNHLLLESKLERCFVDYFGGEGIARQDFVERVVAEPLQRSETQRCH